MRGMPPDPEWSPLERLVLPFTYHGLSVRSAVVFSVWSFVVCALTGGMALSAVLMLDAPVPAVLPALLCVWCGLAGEALRRHAARLRRQARWTQPDPDEG